MKPGHFVLLVGFLLAASLSSASIAGPTEDANAAYKIGDYATAIRLWRDLAEQGDAEAQTNLGHMYRTGRGVAKDDAVAAQWVRKAAEQGNARAESTLGAMYASGSGVAKDDTEAVKWYRKAAEQGFAFAQTNLGVMYANGSGVAKDDIEAVKWYRKAAEQGDALAQRNLGSMYLTGRGGVPADAQQAAEWYRRAAERGDTIAQNNFAQLYAQFLQKADSSDVAIGFLEHERQRIYIALVRDHKNVELVVNGRTVTQENVVAFSNQNERELQVLSDEVKRRGYVMVAGEYKTKQDIVQQDEKISPCATPEVLFGPVTVVQDGSTIEFRDAAGKFSGYGVIVQSTIGVMPGARDQVSPLVLLGTITGDGMSLVRRDRSPMALDPNATPSICRIGILSK